MIQTKRHAEDVFDEPWFSAKPWLIAGTGPSLSQANILDIQRKFNILSIYNAVDLLGADLYFCLDDDGWRYRPTTDYRYAVARLDSKRDLPENTLYIAVHNNPQYPGKEGYPSQTSNAHAVEYLSRAGVKTVYIIGIDGGKGVTSEGINQAYRDHCGQVDFDAENVIMYATAKRVGVELVKLNGQANKIPT